MVVKMAAVTRGDVEMESDEWQDSVIRFLVWACGACMQISR